MQGFHEQIWADTLFMVCIFLVKLGNLSGNKKYIDEAEKQLVIHHKVLKDKVTGLFFHGYNCENKDWMSGALWARANAWVTISTVEILEELPRAFKGRENIITSMLEQVESLEKFQRKNGMFGTLLNQEDAYDETSGYSSGILLENQLMIELRVAMEFQYGSQNSLYYHKLLLLISNLMR